MRNRFRATIIFFISALLYCFLPECTKAPIAPPPTTGTGNTITQVIASFTNTKLFNDLINKAGLDSTLSGTGPFTVFIATDSAFDLLGLDSMVINNTPDSFLFRLGSYAIIGGLSLGSANLPTGPDAKIITAGGDSIYVSNGINGIFVNGIPVTQPNVPASNGTINGILSPLVPPNGTLLQTFQLDTIYSYMSAAIARASQGSTNLDSILTYSPFTVFVPTNSAFQAAGYSSINDINSADPDTLANLVANHILPTRLFSSDFTQTNEPVNLNGSTLDILPGAVIEIKGNGNTGFVNINTTNIMASNGVIHIVSGLLLP